MDFKNKSIKLEQITSFDVNKAIQRSLTKAVARHGLGLYIYAGEDLPEDAEPKEKKLTFREKVIILAKEKGIDVKELARDYGLNNKTTEARYEEVYADLTGK